MSFEFNLNGSGIEFQFFMTYCTCKRNKNNYFEYYSRSFFFKTYSHMWWDNIKNNHDVCFGHRGQEPFLKVKKII